MVMEKFYESPVDTIPGSANMINGINYKILHAPDYSLVRYTTVHFADFVKGFQQLIAVFDNDQSPEFFRGYIQRAARLLKHETIEKLENRKKDLQSEMKKLKKSSANAYEKVEDGVKKAWLNLKESVQAAKKEFE